MFQKSRNPGHRAEVATLGGHFPRCLNDDDQGCGFFVRAGSAQEGPRCSRNLRATV